MKAGLRLQTENTGARYVKTSCIRVGFHSFTVYFNTIIHVYTLENICKILLLTHQPEVINKIQNPGKSGKCVWQEVSKKGTYLRTKSRIFSSFKGRIKTQISSLCLCPKTGKIFVQVIAIFTHKCQRMCRSISHIMLTSITIK